MNKRKGVTVGFKNIMISEENHTRLAAITTKNKIYNDIITELLDLWETKKK